MSTPTNDPLDALIASYVQAIEAGRVPNRQGLLDGNPDHAEALQTFFNDFDRMDRVASPLRMAGDLDETAALDGAGLTQLPTLRYFGDYELLEEIAQGGMGIVYKARQTSLNRLVALKMIRAGTFATPREVARFQSEAEAAANLDHPHIVPVHEVGEHEGYQYFSMKFLEGGSLSNHPRGEIKPEVLGLITIARAVHHAHQRGVLHRDLKPSNILIDAQGDRHVTDFGLAKRLSDLDRSLTEAGQVLGTPRYMSPEQALGRKDLTVATDIYALGVILYERLTGRTPFVGETALAILRQVRESEPPRPSTFLPNLGRDLETIVLKCLEKDPTRRYPTAEDLVEDLTRWLEGRPINARPVGQAERFARWCRRNPAVAGLTASVLLASILGTVVSGLIALKERKERLRAEKAEDNTEGTFARSLVRPLDPDGDQDAHLSTTEVEALWELASEGTESLRLRVLSEATRSPSTLRQLCARSEPALIAAVGLDPARQANASRLLAANPIDPDHPTPAEVDRAFLMLEVEDRLTPSAKAAAETIARAITRKVPEVHVWRWKTHIRKSHPRLDPTLAAHLFSKAIAWEGNMKEKKNLALILSQVLKKLGTQEKAAVQATIDDGLMAWLDFIIDQLVRDDYEGDAEFRSSEWDERLREVVASLGAESAQRACGRAAKKLIDNMVGLKDTPHNYVALTSFVEISSGLTPHDSEKAFGKAIELMLGSFDFMELCYTGGARPYSHPNYKIWKEFTKRIGPFEGDRIAHDLLERLRSAPNAAARRNLSFLLQPLSAWLKPGEASPIARMVADSLGREPDPSVRDNITATLSVMSEYIDPSEATPIARALSNAMAHETAEIVRNRPDMMGSEEKRWLHDDMFEAFIKVVGRLKKAEIAMFARDLSDALEREKDATCCYDLAETIGAIAEKLDPADAFPIARSLSNLLQRSSSLKSREFYDSEKITQDAVRSLAAVAARLNPDEAIPFARSIVEFSEARSDDQSVDVKALSKIAWRLAPDQAAQIFTRVAHSFAKRIETETGSTQSISDLYSDNIFHLVDTLVQLSGHLTSDEASRLCGRVARSLVDAMNRGSGSKERDYLLALGQVIPWLALDEKARLCDEANRIFLRSANTSDLRSLIEQDYPPQLLDGASPSNARAVAQELSSRICSEDSNIDLSGAGFYAGRGTKLIRSLLTDANHDLRVERSVSFAATTMGWGHGSTAMAITREATHPYPCRLTSQELVELLKMPTCFGATRRVVLDQLGHIHGRRFFNHWDFVRFAKAKGLPLDFASPPRRPDPKASLKRLLDESASGSLRSGEKP